MADTSSQSKVKLSHKVVIQQQENQFKKGKIILKPNSISVIAVKTPKVPDTNILYEVDSEFQLPEGIIPLDVLHKVDHKMPRELNIHRLNISSNSLSTNKNTLIGTLTPATKVENICSINWSTLDEAITKASK